MPQLLDNLACALRAAVLASDHEKGERLTVEYTAAVTQHWTLLPAEERAASPLPKQSLELLNWAREMTLMQQALASTHLAATERASRQLTARALYLQLAALDSRG
jgi:hypothetical protein